MNKPAVGDSSRYQLIAKLGHGGMARVFLVLSRGRAGVNKLLVMKELLPDLKEDPEYTEMFLGEARLAVRLNHPNVIQTYEVISDGEHPAIVMEYLEGQTLSVLLHRIGLSRFPVGLHLHILAEVLAGLHHAHELRDFDGTSLHVVHRDVNPQNVFLTYEGQVKLVDFGIAKTISSEQTRTGVFKGKANYASPEQVLAQPVDRRADVFAVGTMLWEALAHQRISFGKSEIEVLQIRVAGNEPKVQAVAPETPDEIARIGDKARARSRDDRYATAEEFRAELAAYLETTKTRGARELAQLMQKTFAEEREVIRRKIDARVKELDSAESSSSLLLIDTATNAEGEKVPSIGTQGGTALTNDPGISSRVAVRQIGALRRTYPLLLGAAALVVALLVGLQLFRRRKDDATAAIDASAVARSVDADSTTADDAVVSITISVNPPEARASFDGAVLTTNPFHATVPRSSQAHHVRVAAPGYVTEERLMVFDRDAIVQLDLKQKTSPPSTESPPPPRVTRAPSLAGHPPAPAPAPPPRSTPSPTPQAAAASAASPSPGDAITPATRKKPAAIDETF